METKLHFTITKIDGSKLTQDITCPEGATDAAMNQVFAQYSQIGFLKKDPTGKATLIPSNQIALVECVPLSSLVVSATSQEVAKITNGITRIK